MVETLEARAAEATEAEKKYAAAKKESDERLLRAEEAEAKIEQMQEAVHRWDAIFSLLFSKSVVGPNVCDLSENESENLNGRNVPRTTQKSGVGMFRNFLTGLTLKVDRKQLLTLTR